MNYHFIKDDAPLSERFWQLYPEGLKEKVFNEAFVPDYHQEVLNKGHAFIESLKGHKVLVIGDYDCDGICSTTIIKKLLDDLKIANNYYIPSRFNEGYGLSLEHVQKALAFDFDTLITVDNGIVAHEALKLAKDQHLITAVIDHHEYVDLPDVDYVLHGNLLAKPYQKCCASGLAYLLSATFKEDPLLETYAGIATLADMVEVFDYNRYLIKKALQHLNTMTILPINALSHKKTYEYDDLSFTIIAKINAVSRLLSGQSVNMLVRFLLEDDLSKIKTTVATIDETYRLRKALSDGMYQKAGTLCQDDPIMVLYDPSFHEGLCGLVANRLSREYQRPCMVLAGEGDVLKGSVRSYGTFDILAYLKEYDNYFTRLGGHMQAAGITMGKKQLEAFKNALKERPLTFEEPLSLCLMIKEEELTESTSAFLKSLQPFGTGFEEPLFALEDPKIQNSFLIQNKYPKLTLSSGLSAICFAQDHCPATINKLVGYLRLDRYHKNRLQMQIQSFL